ncbi:2-oxoglutarate dehydrogenase complex dihydrolipoyllysine-residue succinyltransferase [Sediminicurvatus halobius]|uniref:Dihydrolipoyllysine-residue succinyltransferase component of 2-oxoglutarate dehydrogenase complex n=1 Tax=Sediminicurvatus halobius TaxID=2182432 RepID=A0A2U2MZE3_9GAMM|nr:2-oxoglutarate dehydrogenase complex dihydrolipoyllysine-residue succinyltransferase [Spiribacter halobius]PWG62250.1 dihydrolipoamide succinyltransferase [Spiribacter halobius]UEX78161.1 2-oxoglutarate dehydrogenase complex dihydrolipoyllysine-residue succinyltransferase [Spiribacter halobius]
MSTEVKVPALPESVSEATVVTWHKQKGDTVERDENLVDLETDKVVLEVPAPDDGVLGDILKSEGDTVTANEVIAMLEAGGGGSSGGGEAAAESQPAAPETSSAATAGETQQAAASEPAAAPARGDGDVAPLSPAVRRMVAEHELDPSRIPATGPGGRITKEDVVRYLDNGGDAAPQPQAPAPAPVGRFSQEQPARSPEAEAMPAGGEAPAGERPERRVPMTRLRQRIAERLVEAQQTAAMLTTFNEVNMQPVMEVRGRYKERFEKAHGIKLGFMSFFVKAAVEALKRFPSVNASIDGKDIIYHGYYDIGIAVSTERGLMVPVLRDADQLSFAEIENAIADFGQRAKAGKIGLEELTGGTFTITNGGIFGSLVSTPILNPPQSGILGMHKIQERPMAEDGQVVVRPMMYLAHSYDHRIIDGREAVQFLVTIKDMLEDPARLLLEV